MKAIWRPISEKPAVPCSAIIRLTPAPGTGEGDTSPLLMARLHRFDLATQDWHDEVSGEPILYRIGMTYHWALEDDLVALI